MVSVRFIALERPLSGERNVAEGSTPAIRRRSTCEISGTSRSSGAGAGDSGSSPLTTACASARLRAENTQKAVLAALQKVNSLPDDDVLEDQEPYQLDLPLEAPLISVLPRPGDPKRPLTFAHCAT